MYFYCILTLFSKQSMKEFGPLEMIYLSLAQLSGQQLLFATQTIFL